MKYSILFVCCLISSVLYSQEFSPRYELVKMNDNVNTRHNEVSPVISPDGKSLYYFVANHPENTYGKDGSQDIWVSSVDDNGQWSKALGFTL
jgi:OmpA-OmpF porin, OOP family